MTLMIPWHDDYAEWKFSNNSATQGRRFTNFMDLIKEDGTKFETFEPAPIMIKDLAYAHLVQYLEEVVVDGLSDEWVGPNHFLANTARLMAGGTLEGARMIIKGEATRVFNPTGAKHHAQSDHSSGFCVFADFAIAAKELYQMNGLRVSILDIDAHHGDGTENILRGMPGVQTISIHEHGIFPGTGLVSYPECNAWNFPLPGNSGTEELNFALDKAAWLIEQHRPDVLMLAAGADGHETDPLSSLKYTMSDFRHIGRAVDILSKELCNGRLIVGGAGGYQPDTYTPAAWAAIAEEIA